MAGGGGLSEPSALATEFQSGERVTAADCRGLCGVVEQWAAPMGRLLRHDKRMADGIGKEARGQAGWDWGNLAVVDGDVLATGDGAGGQGCLRDRTASRRRGGRDRVWDTCSPHGTLTAPR